MHFKRIPDEDSHPLHKSVEPMGGRIVQLARNWICNPYIAGSNFAAGGVVF